MQGAKIIKLKEAPPPPSADNQRVITTLEQALRRARDDGYTQVGIVLATPGYGYVAAFSTEDTATEHGNSGQLYNLLGSVCMLRKFIEDTAEQGG